MANKKNARRALISSVISLILCCTMFVGTTFAWFTDSVTSGVNTIAAGNLDVELYHSDKNANNVPVDGSTKLFDDVTLWEPGAVVYENFVVANEGNLALKYQLSINFENETVVNGHCLSEALKVAVVMGGFTGDRAAAQTLTGWQSLSSFTLSSELEGDEKSDTYGIVIYWEPTENDNWFNMKDVEKNEDGSAKEALSIDLGINLFATQEMYENDSFGEDYDDEAWHPDMLIYTADDLNDALANGLNAKLMNDIDLSGSDSNINVPESVATTYSLRNPVAVATVIDLNGYTITGTVGRDDQGNRVHTLVNNGNLILTNGTIKSAGENGGSAIYNAAGAELVLENVTVLGAPKADGGWPSYGINNYGTMTVNGATVKTYHGGIATGGEGVTVINDANVDVGQGTATGITSYTLYTESTAKLTVNGGTYANTASDAKSTGGAIACEGGDNAIVINGGNFSGGCGLYNSYVISGGQFDHRVDKSNLADGYQCKAINGEYHVVTSDTMLAYEITGLKGHLESTATKKVMLVGNITVNNTTITVPSGANIELDLNGYTISSNNTNTNTHNFLIDVKGGTLSVKNGTIEMVHTGTNMAWNGAATVIDVTAGGVLNLEGVTVENLGGTDMNFAVHLNNWGEVTMNADNCVFKAPYCSVRVFNSGGDMNNVKITNSTLTGNKMAFWVHNYDSSDLSTWYYSDGTKGAYDQAKVDARLNLDIYGNNNSFVVTSDAYPTPIRYGFNKGVYFNADGAQIVSDASQLATAVAAGGTVVLNDDIEVSEVLKISEDTVINGNGKTLTYTGSDRAITVAPVDGAVVDLTISDLTVDCSASYCNRAINYNETGNLVLNNVKVTGTPTYGINLQAMSDGVNVEINGGSYSACIPLNIWGENSVIVANDVEFITVDNADSEGYATIALNNDGTDSANGSVVTINGGSITVTGSNTTGSYAVRNNTATGVINISDSTTVTGETMHAVSVVKYEGTKDFYSHSYNPPFCERHRRGYETHGLSHIIKICYNNPGEFGILQNPWR